MKLLFAPAERIRKIQFCNCQVQFLKPPKNKQPSNEMSHGGLSQDRNSINETNSPFSPGRKQFRDRAARLTDPNAESETGEQD
jgi:hypothetical protein